VLAMVNGSIKSSVCGRIGTAIREARDAAAVDHAGMRGRIREIATGNLFEPLLTGQINIGTGKIIDHSGFQSQQTDVILYSKGILPSLLYSNRTDDGLFPSETSLYAIEVKSKVTSTELRDAIEKARTLRQLKYTSGVYDELGREIPHLIPMVLPAFFAFGSDLTEDGMSELDRYIGLDPDAEFNPLIPVICVVGRGYWYFKRNDSFDGVSLGRWWYWEPTAEHDEVIGFLSGILNTIPDLVAARLRPRFGKYILSREGVIAKECFWRHTISGPERIQINRAVE
jgi:hypothetical protein